MPAPMKRTRHPGIYRRGARYVVVYLVNGRQRKEATRTLDEALRLKRSRETDRDRGEFLADSRVPFQQYAEEWIATYQGTGRRGFSETSRDDYRRSLEIYAYPFFDVRLGRTLSGVTPRDIARWIAWLCDEGEQGRRLTDASVRRIAAPVRSCLATAKREGLIRHNPADGAALPHRPRIEDDEPKARALTRAQLSMLLRVAHPDYKLMFWFIAATGVRYSELAAVRWLDLELEGSSRRLKVRRAFVRGTFKPPKSEHGRRDVPLSRDLAAALSHARGAAPDRDLVFVSSRGNPPNRVNVMRRYLKPAVEEVGAPWAGFHSLRHTCASMLFAEGRNIRQVQRWLGHHSPSFTLDTYVHLLDEGVGDGLEMPDGVGGGNEVAIRGAELGRSPDAPHGRESAIPGVIAD